MKRLCFVLSVILLAFLIDLAMTQKVQAQDASTAASAVVATVSTPVAQTPVAVIPVVADPVVIVPAPAALPVWVGAVLTSVSKLPIVGPYASQILMWFGILATILTTLAGAALSILNSLKNAFTWAGLSSAVTAVQSFQNGKIMFYLKYFSNFNAQKQV